MNKITFDFPDSGTRRPEIRTAENGLFIRRFTLWNTIYYN